MGYKLELNPEAFARTQQGGCIMTATDTDTSIIEPFMLREGRASGRTAVGRDGLLYDVLPYEPAMTLVDGVMVLSEEPLGENLYSFTNFSDVTETAFKIKNSSNVFPEKNSLKFISDGSNRVTSDKTMNLDANSTYFFSVYVEGFEQNVNINQIIIALTNPSGASSEYSLDEGNTYLPTGNDIYDIPNNTRVVLRTITSGTSGSQVLRIGIGALSQTIASSVTFSNPQYEKNSLSSFVANETSGSKVRLGATGVNTPDISKYINSKNVTIEFELKTNYPNASAYSQISLSSGLIENRIMLYPLSDTSVGITLTVDGASIVTGIKTCPSLSADYVAFKIEVTESAYTCSANGSIIHNQDLSTDPSFEVDTLKYFKLSGPLSGYPFKGEIRNLKIS